MIAIDPKTGELSIDESRCALSVENVWEINLQDGSKIEISCLSDCSHQPQWNITSKEIPTINWKPDGTLIAKLGKLDQVAFRSRYIHLIGTGNEIKNTTLWADEKVVNFGSLCVSDSSILAPCIFNFGCLTSIKDRKELRELGTKYPYSVIQNPNTITSMYPELFSRFTNFKGLYNVGIISIDENIRLTDLPVYTHGVFNANNVLQVGNDPLLQIKDSAYKDVFLSAKQQYEWQPDKKENGKFETAIKKLQGTKEIFADNVEIRSDRIVSKEGNSDYVDIKSDNIPSVFPLLTKAKELIAGSQRTVQATLGIKDILKRLKSDLFTNKCVDPEALYEMHIENNDAVSFLLKVRNYDVAKIKDSIVRNSKNKIQSMSFADESDMELGTFGCGICKPIITRRYLGKKDWQGLYRKEDLNNHKSEIENVYKMLFEDCKTISEEVLTKLSLEKLTPMSDNDQVKHEQFTKYDMLKNEFSARVYVEYENSKKVYIATVRFVVMPNGNVFVSDYLTGVPATQIGAGYLVKLLNKIRNRNDADVQNIYENELVQAIENQDPLKHLEELEEELKDQTNLEEVRRILNNINEVSDQKAEQKTDQLKQLEGLEEKLKNPENLEEVWETLNEIDNISEQKVKSMPKDLESLKNRIVSTKENLNNELSELVKILIERARKKF